MSQMNLSGYYPPANPKAGSSTSSPQVPAAASAPPANEDAPPPYTTLPRSPSEAGASPWIGAGGASTSGYAPSGVKLGYVDFVPRVVTKKMFGPDEYETFDTLIQRANTWLGEHQGIQIVSCETVTWSSLKTKNIFPDTCLYSKSINAQKQTKYLRGLRIWYFVEVFPSTHSNSTSPQIQCKTFIPRRQERFDQLLSRVNKFLSSDRLGGQIISVETLRCRDIDPDIAYTTAHIKPNQCFWKEYPDTKKRYAFCLRVFALFGQSMEGYETIGYQDFVPEQNQRNQENGGFEVFSDVMQKANRWIARQQGVRFTDLQTFYVKLKKKGPFEERCIFIEHIAANGRTNVFKGRNRQTKYIRVARAFYVILQSSGTRPEYPPVRLTYRTFTPAQIGVARTNTPIEYEGMRTLLDRINQWLQITNARVFHIETVPIKLTTHTRGLQVLGSEATLCKNAAKGSSISEKWLYHVRVYLDGEYLEPPGAVSLVTPANMQIL